MKGDVVIKDLFFAYPSRPDAVVLNGVSLHLESGKLNALVGSIGSGKSSITHLIMGLYKPTSGTITIDGVNVSELELEWLHSKIGIVEQDPKMFNMSISKNIAYGVPDASQEQIEKAAKLACIHDFIVQLPKGYETNLGESGSALSGGQRKLMSIARAVLKDPVILILDEPTSSLDNENTQAVTQALSQIISGRTVIVVAHNLTTITAAQHIFVMRVSFS